MAKRVFPGKVAPWYRGVVAAGAAVVAVLALQTQTSGLSPIVTAVAFALWAALLLPSLVRNRVELHADHLEVVCGLGRTLIPYDHVRGARRVTGAIDVGTFTAHNAALSGDAVFVDAPEDGDALVSVTDNDALLEALLAHVR